MLPASLTRQIVIAAPFVKHQRNPTEAALQFISAQGAVAKLSAGYATLAAAAAPQGELRGMARVRAAFERANSTAPGNVPAHIRAVSKAALSAPAPAGKELRGHSRLVAAFARQNAAALGSMAAHIRGLNARSSGTD